jgi:ubiquinone biosynthesis protein
MPQNRPHRVSILTGGQALPFWPFAGGNLKFGLQRTHRPRANQFISTLARLVNVSRVMLVYAASFLIGKRLPEKSRIAGMFGIQPWGPQRLRMLIEELGGTFIKFGQVLALQPDVIPIEYCNALFDLMDRVAGFDYKWVEQVFLEDLGDTPDKLFDSFDPEPLATASIGQVHIATLTGRKYAVKVQRPDVDIQFENDIRLMSAAIRMIRAFRIRSLFWIIEPLSEFIAWTREELDYRNEARYMQQLALNAEQREIERVPRGLPEYTTKRILAAEFLEGVTVLDYLRALQSGDSWLLHRLKSTGFVPERFAANIVDNFLGDAFQRGIFHADLHPANLIILPDSVVGYIDFGITAVLSSYSRRHLVDLTLAYARGDLDGMSSAFLRVSDMEETSDPAGFRKGLSALSTGWYSEPGEGPRLRKSITLMMMDLLTLSRKTGLWPERDVIKYIRSAIALDGLIKRFAPSFDVGLHLERICEDQIKWRLRRSMFSQTTLMAWGSESSELARFGILRAGSLLDQFQTGQFSIRLEGRDKKRRRSRDVKLVQLSAIILVVAICGSVGGAGTPHFGFNLFTAEASIATASVAAFLANLHRLI